MAHKRALCAPLGRLSATVACSQAIADMTRLCRAKEAKGNRPPQALVQPRLNRT
jgi:hypothetical protein